MAKSSRLPLIMERQLINAHKDDSMNLLMFYNHSNVKEWYFMALNLPEPYIDGEFIFTLTATDEFPQKPPIFQFITPNGVYEPGGKICISIGEFHSTSHSKDGAFGWRPVLGMIGFAREVINGLICPDTLGNGIRIIPNINKENCSILAKASKNFNKTYYPNILKRFDNLAANYPNLTAIKYRNIWNAVLQFADMDVYSSEEMYLSVLEMTLLTSEWQIISSSITECNVHQLNELDPLIKRIITSRDLVIRPVLLLLLTIQIKIVLNKDYVDEIVNLREKIVDVCGSIHRESIPIMIPFIDFSKDLYKIIDFVMEQDIDKKNAIGYEIINV